MITRTAFVVFVALLVQTTVFAQVTVLGVHAELMILVAFSAGLVAGPQRGAMIGFAAGVASDLIAETPFGLMALVAALVGYAAGMARESLDRPVRWVPMAAAAAATAAGVLTYASLGEVLGQDYFVSDITRIVLIVSLLNALMAPSARRVLRWAAGTDVSGATT